MIWNISQAVELCRTLEDLTRPLEWHVGLTGGVLYKDGQRKDCDVILYSTQRSQLDAKQLLSRISALPEVTAFRRYGYVTKFDYNGKPVDILMPELKGQEGEYPIGEGLVEFPAIVEEFKP